MDHFGKLQLFPKKLLDKYNSTTSSKFVQGLHLTIHPVPCMVVHFLHFVCFFYEPTLRHIKECTISEAQCFTGDTKPSVPLDELEKFIGFVITRGVISGCNLPIKSF